MIPLYEDKYLYPVIQISQAQIKKLEQLVGCEIKTNDDISYCINVLINEC